METAEPTSFLSLGVEWALRDLVFWGSILRVWAGLGMYWDGLGMYPHVCLLYCHRSLWITISMLFCGCSCFCASSRPAGVSTTCFGWCPKHLKTSIIWHRKANCQVAGVTTTSEFGNWYSGKEQIKGQSQLRTGNCSFRILAEVSEIWCSPDSDGFCPHNPHKSARL